MEPFLNMNNLKSSISHLEDSYQSCKLRNFFQKFNTKRQIKVLDWGRWKRSNIQLSISDSWILRRIAPLNTETLFHIYIKVENSSNYFENLFCCETIRDKYVRRSSKQENRKQRFWLDLVYSRSLWLKIQTREAYFLCL